MFETVFAGVLLGIILAFLIGPVFFRMIDLALESHWKNAVFFASGVWMSDFVVWYVCFYIVYRSGIDFFETWWMYAVASLIFLLFGVTKLLSNQSSKLNLNLPIKVAGFSGLLMQGIMVNALNPSVWGFWLASVPVSLEISNGKKNLIFLYMFSVFMTLIFTDLLKIFLAVKVKHFLTDKVIKGFGLVSSILFVMASFWLAYEAYIRLD